MKYFVTTTDGYIKAKSKNEAIETLKETSNACEVIEVDETELPVDCVAEDVIYSCERVVIAKK